MYQYHQEAHESMLKSALKSWVMTSANEAAFVKLPNERILYTSPPRTSLSLSSTNSFPGTQPWAVKSSDGTVYITNQRVRLLLMLVPGTDRSFFYHLVDFTNITQIVYMPTSPSPELQSFSAPILNLEDSYVRVP